MASMLSTTSNVGLEGGDLATRRFALLVTLALTCIAVPWLGFSHAALKIAALMGAMSGTLFLMAGLVFAQKTHYAGVALIPVPLGMVGLSAAGWRWIAVGVGLIAMAGIVQNLVTRRCGLNRLLGINSCTCDL